MVLRESDSKLTVGDAAPEFSLPGTDGETYTPGSFADYEALLVVFTCNHCPYAQAKFDELNYLARTYDELAVVGINPNDAEEYPEDSFDRMRELVEEGTIQYTAYLRDESQEVAREYGAVCTPDPFLFERDADGLRPSSDRTESGEGGEFRLAFHSRIDDATSPDDEVTAYEMRTAVEAVISGDEIPVEEAPSQGCSIKWRD